MPTHVLIVEGDTVLSGRVRSALQQRGHTVEETTDGRSVIDLVRRRPPGVVVLSVELPGGQNGYLLVGKLKKDDALKSIPVIIVGNPEGFGAHSRLKNRADEYLPKPVDLPTLLAAVARLSGASEETPLVLDEEATVSGDPDLDLIDAAFDDLPGPPPPNAPAPRAPPPDPVASAHPPPSEDDFSDLAPDEEGPTLVQFGRAPLPGAEVGPAQPGEQGGEPVLAPADLAAPGEDEQARAFAAEVQAAQRALVEQDPGEAQAGPEELLRLRSELHAAQQLVEDLRDQHAQAEQRELELRAELARRDGQLKAIQGRLDQAAQERRRLEQALQSGGRAEGDEAHRALEEQLAAAQRDLELNRAHADGAERQLQVLHQRAEAAEVELARLREQQEGGTSPEEVESLRARLTELESEARKNRDRVTRLYARLKSEERAREKARKAVTVAGQLLAEQSAAPLESVGAEPEPGTDEPAAA